MLQTAGLASLQTTLYIYIFFAYISRAEGSEKHQLGPCSMPWNAIERIQQKKVSCKFS